jgi:hypothetical protein
MLGRCARGWISLTGAARHAIEQRAREELPQALQESAN